jgi:hypothetical protein
MISNPGASMKAVPVPIQPETLVSPLSGLTHNS